MKSIAKAVLILTVFGAIVANAETLLVDNFTTDTTLNTSLWTTGSSFLTALAAASSSPPASFVSPQLTYNSQFGMTMTGPTEDYQTTAVQSLSTFTPPFKVVTYVTAAGGTANPFEIFLASPDLTQFLSVTANVSSTYYGLWATAPNVSQLWQLGEQFSPPISPNFYAPYIVTISVNAKGVATVTIENFVGTVLGRVSKLKAGTGPFYLVLGQRIGLTATGSQFADWFSVKVTAP
ncbi:MAG: hypothetical protein ACLPVW_17090 [Terriglobales bacterium]